jgi:cation:H+ antiporter
MASAVEKLGKTFDRDAFLAGRAHGHWFESGFGTVDAPDFLSRQHPSRDPLPGEPAMVTTIALLILSAAIIYWSCEYFVNGVEWIGQRFGLTQNATGTVLAAFGTALPESVVTFVAVAFGKDASSKEIGIGAALGGPLVLATIAYAVVGITYLSMKDKMRWSGVMRTTGALMARDQRWFMCIFVFKLALGLVAFAFKPWLGVLFLLAYGAYVFQSMSAEGELAVAEDLEPLKLRPRAATPHAGWALLQTALALVVIFLASQLFVHRLEDIGPMLGMPPQIVALLLSPIATELPETLNAVIWVRQRKPDLALANISGAMMIQATIPSALGMFFTPWLLDRALVWAGVVTMMSIAGLYMLIKLRKLTARRFAMFALLYGVFGIGLVWAVGR